MASNRQLLKQARVAALEDKAPADHLPIGPPSTRKRLLNARPICATELISESTPAALGHPLVFASGVGIVVHPNTSLYIKMNEVERRLGTYIYEYERNLS